MDGLDGRKGERGDYGYFGLVGEKGEASFSGKHKLNLFVSVLSKFEHHQKCITEHFWLGYCAALRHIENFQTYFFGSIFAGTE